MKQETIKPAAFHQLVREAKQMGNVFFGIVGGEPFMHPHLLDMLAGHPDCYFQIFTNGHFITPERAKQMWRLGNVTPLISVEGTEIVSDERRGRGGVLSKTMQGLRNALGAGVFTGVCTSLARTNIDDLLREEWIDRLVEMGVLYTWFHVYRPMGPTRTRTCASHRNRRSGRGSSCRDACAKADRHHRRVPRRRGQGAVPGPRPGSATTSTRGATSNRARSCSSRRNRSTARRTRGP